MNCCVESVGSIPDCSYPVSIQGGDDIFSKPHEQTYGALAETSTLDSTLRYSAFTHDGAGGNPAGVWIGKGLPSTADMQETARKIGFSETAFIDVRHDTPNTVRYFSPEAEVSFCGHATIAAGVALASISGPGTFRLTTGVGLVTVDVTIDKDARHTATFYTVDTRHTMPRADVVLEVLDLLNITASNLDSRVPIAEAYAGAWHLVIALESRKTLAGLSYDFHSLKKVMLREGWTTLQVVYIESAGIVHARNPFPVGGVFEDPATGAAAAALGGYLRDAKLADGPFRLTVLQGFDMGQPCEITVDVSRVGGVAVSGAAAEIARSNDR